MVYICKKCGSKTVKPGYCIGPSRKRHVQTLRVEYVPKVTGGIRGPGPNSLGHDL